MGGIIDKVATIGGTSNADKMATAGRLEARFAGQAAKAREASLKEAVGFAQEGLEAARLPSDPQQLAALRQSLDVQGQNLDRQTKLFESIDPAVMEASKQALQLMQGEEAK